MQQITKKLSVIIAAAVAFWLCGDFTSTMMFFYGEDIFRTLGGVPFGLLCALFVVGKRPLWRGIAKIFIVITCIAFTWEAALFTFWCLSGLEGMRQLHMLAYAHMAICACGMVGGAGTFLSVWMVSRRKHTILEALFYFIGAITIGGVSAISLWQWIDTNLPIDSGITGFGVDVRYFDMFGMGLIIWQMAVGTYLITIEYAAPQHKLRLPA